VSISVVKCSWVKGGVVKCSEVLQFSGVLLVYFYLYLFIYFIFVYMVVYFVYFCLIMYSYCYVYSVLYILFSSCQLALSGYPD